MRKIFNGIAIGGLLLTVSCRVTPPPDDLVLQDDPSYTQGDSSLFAKEFRGVLGNWAWTYTREVDLCDPDFTPVIYSPASQGSYSMLLSALGRAYFVKNEAVLTDYPIVSPEAYPYQTPVLSNAIAFAFELDSLEGRSKISGYVNRDSIITYFGFPIGDPNDPCREYLNIFTKQ